MSMTMEWLQAQLQAFSVEQSGTHEDLSAKYAYIIMKRIEKKEDVK